LKLFSADGLGRPEPVPLDQPGRVAGVAEVEQRRRNSSTVPKVRTQTDRGEVRFQKRRGGLWSSGMGAKPPIL
jgi:hypothetical protein